MSMTTMDVEMESRSVRSKDEILRVMSSRGESSRKEVNVCFVDIKYTVRDRAAKRGDGVKEKVILDSVTGLFSPGTMTALMGPSGCGKTTLLDILAGRKTSGKIEGDIRYNGVKPSASLLKTTVGYVEQFDTLVPNLTVFEMLLYTAYLKRPSSESKEDKEKRVDAVIASLQLENCRNTIIGDPLTKGISGGQAKRVNIGLALISQPDVIFMDEPTTGLDSYMANEVVSIIRELCTISSLTICATIHSPTAFSFNQFDRLLMLIKGQVVFNGVIGDDGMNVRNFFEFQGYQYPKTISYSVIEWLTDVVSGGYELTCRSFDEKDYSSVSVNSVVEEPEMRILNGNGETSKSNNDDNDEPSADQSAQLIKYYEQSELYIQVREDVIMSLKSSGVNIENQEQKAFDQIMPTTMSTGTTVSGIYALGILVWFRGLKSLKDPVYIAPRLGDKILFGFIVMSLFWGVGNDFSGGGIQSTLSVLFMVTALNGFGAAAYVPTLVLQRPLFYRERCDGLYTEATYLTFLIGMEASLATVTCSLYCIIVYWAINFNLNFGLLWVNYYISSLIGICAAYFFAAACPNLEIANALLPIYMVLNLFFGGLFVPYRDIPKYWQWYSYIDFVRWSWGSLVVGQYSNKNEVFIGSETVLDFFDLRPNSEWQLLGYLSIFLPVFIGLAWLALKFINHSSR